MPCSKASGLSKAAAACGACFELGPDRALERHSLLGGLFVGLSAALGRFGRPLLDRRSEQRSRCGEGERLEPTEQLDSARPFAVVRADRRELKPQCDQVRKDQQGVDDTRDS
jgi:hypothetical protein